MAEPPMSAADYRALLDRSMEELRLTAAAHDALWQFGSASWSVDQDTGVIIFTGKKYTVTAQAQIIGSYNTLDSTWLWSWDNPSIEPRMAVDAHRVHAFGQEHGLADLTTRKLECDEIAAWELAALACHLCKAQGAYRGPAGTAMVFLTFGEVAMTLAKKKGGGLFKNLFK